MVLPILFQSTRPLRGATPTPESPRSIFALFQSTRPLRGATVLAAIIHAAESISIHAPLAGRDRLQIRNWEDKDDFNPRAP